MDQISKAHLSFLIKLIFKLSHGLRNIDTLTRVYQLFSHNTFDNLPLIVIKAEKLVPTIKKGRKQCLVSF